MPLTNRMLKAARTVGDTYSKTADALFQYLRTLFELLPWHASPLVFSGEQAFELGIAQL